MNRPEIKLPPRAVPPRYPGNVGIERLYLKNLSWDVAGPGHVPKSLDQPVLEVNFNARHALVAGQPLLLNVELALRADCRLMAKPLFIAEFVQAGIFRLADAAMADDAEVLAYCSAQLYPAARQTLAWLTMVGGFQPLLINDPRLERALWQAPFGQAQARAVLRPDWSTGARNTAPAQQAAAQRRSAMPAALGLIGGLLLGAAVTSLWLTHPMEAATTTIAAADPAPAAPIPPPPPQAVPASATEPLPAAAGDAPGAAVAPIAAVAQAPEIPPAPAKPDRQVELLLQDGHDWLSAQAASHLTVLVAQDEKAEPLLELGALIFDQPLRLTAMPDGHFAAVSGAYATEREARIAVARLARAHQGLSPRIERLTAFRAR